MFPCDVFDQITFVWCFVGTTIKVAHVHLSFSYFWSLLISHFWFWVVAVVEHADKSCCTSLDKVYFIFNISNNNFSQSTLTADIGLMHRVMCSDMLKHNFLSAYINLLSWFQRNWKFAILPLAIYMQVRGRHDKVKCNIIYHFYQSIFKTTLSFIIFIIITFIMAKKTLYHLSFLSW